MIDSKESYIDKPPTNNVINFGATFLVVGTLMVPAITGGPYCLSKLSNPQVYLKGGNSHNEFMQKSRKAQSSWISSESVAASYNTDTLRGFRDDNINNIQENLNVVRGLSFLPLDEALDNKIEEYFESKPVKTKKLFINRRINST